MSIIARVLGPLSTSQIRGVLSGDLGLANNTIKRPARPNDDKGIYYVAHNGEASKSHLTYYPFSTETAIELYSIVYPFLDARPTTSQVVGNCTNNQVAGYSLTSDAVSTWLSLKFSFTNWTFSTTSTPTLGSVVTWGSGTQNSGTAGYVGGGSANTNIARKISFSTETWSNLSAVLSQSRRALGVTGMVNTTTAGYFCGGYADSDSGVIDKINFSNETIAALATGMITATYNPACFSNSSTAGYCGSGAANGVMAKYTFPNDTRSSTGVTISGSNGHVSGQNSGSKGYAFGGYTTKFHNKYTFSTDTNTTGASLVYSATSGNVTYSNMASL